MRMPDFSFFRMRITPRIIKATLIADCIPQKEIWNYLMVLYWSMMLTQVQVKVVHRFIL